MASKQMGMLMGRIKTKARYKDHSNTFGLNWIVLHCTALH